MECEVIQCPVCKSTFAACVVEAIDSEWEENARKYKADGNEVLRMSADAFRFKRCTCTPTSLLSRCQELERENKRLRDFADRIADRFELTPGSVFVLVRDSETWKEIENYAAARAALKNGEV